MLHDFVILYKTHHFLTMENAFLIVECESYKAMNNFCPKLRWRKLLLFLQYSHSIYMYMYKIIFHIFKNLLLSLNFVEH